MSVFSYQEDHQTYWRYYINLRSKKNPTLRLQKSKKGFFTKKEAERAEKFQLLQMTSELSKAESFGCSWAQVIDEWVKFHQLYSTSKYSATTIIDHDSLVKRWTIAWLDRPASELNRGDGRLLLTQVSQMEKSLSYIKRLKATINVIYKWGLEERLIVGPYHSPVYGLEIEKKEQEKLPEILTLEQIQKLLFEAKNRFHPWYPIWAITILTGCRNGEAYGLRHEDLELVSKETAHEQYSLPVHSRNFGMIRLTRAWNSRIQKYGALKARYWRNIPVSGELYKILVGLKSKDFGQDAYGKILLPRFSAWKEGMQAQILRNFCKEIGIPEIRFHTLRACFATHLIAQGISSATVMKICGWRDLKTAQRYIRLAGLDERGATEVLDFIPNDQGIMEKVVNLFDYKK